MNRTTQSGIRRSAAAICGSALLALTLVAAPVSASDAGWGVGCTDTSAVADSNGYNQAAVAHMKGYTDSYSSSGAPSTHSEGYDHVETTGDGGSTASAHGYDEAGNGGSISCDYTIPNPPPPGPGPGPRPDPCTDLPHHPNNAILCVQDILGTAIQLKTPPLGDKHFKGLLALWTKSDNTYSLLAVDYVQNSYVTAQNGGFTLDKDTVFGTLTGSESLFVMPGTLSYDVTHAVNPLTGVTMTASAGSLVLG